MAQGTASAAGTGPTPPKGGRRGKGEVEPPNTVQHATPRVGGYNLMIRRVMMIRVCAFFVIVSYTHIRDLSS